MDGWKFQLVYRVSTTDTFFSLSHFQNQCVTTALQIIVTSGESIFKWEAIYIKWIHPTLKINKNAIKPQLNSPHPHSNSIDEQQKLKIEKPHVCSGCTHSPKC